LTRLQTRGRELAAQTGLPEPEAIEQLAMGQVVERLTGIARLCGRAPVDPETQRGLDFLRNMIGNVGSEHATRISLLQKMDMYLAVAARTCTEGKEMTQAQYASTFVHELVAGLEGRCPDGKNSFFDSWIIAHQLTRFSLRKRATPAAMAGRAQAADEAVVDEDLQYVQCAVANLVVDLKRVFIDHHLAPLLDDYEPRTVSQVLLNNLLRLPLSLPGGFSQVLYPGFAFGDHIAGAAAVFQVENIMRRFLLGGKLSFPSAHVERNLPAMTLGSIGRALRDALQEKRPARLQAAGQAAAARQVLPARVNIVINEERLTRFIAHDPVLLAPYAAFRGAACTQSNAFFDAEAASKPGGAVLRNVARDVVILRLLEVSGYAAVPADFYATVSKDWHLPELPLPA
jgi:hypothetical protein